MFQTICPNMVSLVILFVIVSSSVLAEEEPVCSEGQFFLDSINFYDCKTASFKKLTDNRFNKGSENYEKPSGSFSVCEYIDHLADHCSKEYSSCWTSQDTKEMMTMWMREAVRTTVIYGPPGEIATCDGITDFVDNEERNTIKELTKDSWFRWEAESQNCKYLYGYWSGSYQNNLDRILRCEEKCNPNQEPNNPFITTILTEDQYNNKIAVVPNNIDDPEYMNLAMNNTIINYFTCLDKVGHWENQDLKRNLSHANSNDYKTAKWTTCASLTTYIRECVPILMECLDRGSAENVIAGDAFTMSLSIQDGLAAANDDLFAGFNYTDCDVFGGDQSRAESQRLRMALLCILVFIKYLVI